jgi:hypothetical protein
MGYISSKKQFLSYVTGVKIADFYVSLISCTVNLKKATLSFSMSPMLSDPYLCSVQSYSIMPDS